MRVVRVALVALVVALAACGGDDGGQIAGEVAETTTTTEATTTTTAAPQVGTRDNPAPLGEAAQVGDWTVTLDTFTLDATDAIVAENQFNDPPDEGNVYALVTLSATYDGDDEGQAWLDLDVAVIGDDQRSYSACGAVEPDSLSKQPDVFAGGTTVGNACVQIPADLGSPLVRVEQSFSDAEAWFQP